MQVVILAGGMGTRLKAVAGNRPKALVPVAGRPFIERQLELLRRNGIEEILICVGYKGGMIEEHVGNGRAFGLNVSYSREAPDKLMGTGGALINALPLLRQTFMVLYGDSYLPANYAKVARAFSAAHYPAMMCVFRNDNKWDRSNVKIEDGLVVCYSKKSGGESFSYIDYGLSVYKKSVIEQYLNERLPLDLARVQENLVAERQMAAHVITERFYEIGKPEGLAELEAYFKAK